MASKDIKPGGIFAKKPPEGCPSFVIAKVNIKVDDAIAWLQEQSGEWANLEIKSGEGKEGEYYRMVVNDFDPSKKDKPAPKPEPAPEQPPVDDDLPFEQPDSYPDFRDIPF